MENQWLNYHHLYYFYIIAQQGTIADAAQFLRLGSPTLSVQLKQLEERLNTVLFERENKKLVLTEQGKVVFEYAQEIFKLGSELNQVMRDQRFSKALHFRLGALDCIPKSLIANLVQAARKKFNCSITITEGPMDQLLRELHQHRLDLILTNFSSYSISEEPVYTKSILKSKIAIYGAKALLGYRKNFPKSLHNAPMILPSMTSRLRLELDHYFHLHQIHPEMVAETQDMSVQKLLGARGMGLIPLPSPAAKSIRALIKIGTLEGVYEEYFLVSGHRRIQNPVAAAIFSKFKIND